jgi:hypothetical protein
MKTWLAAATLAIASCAASADATPLVVERAVARYYEPESGVGGGMRFVYERELILGAWLGAYERGGDDVPPPDEKTQRAALERLVLDDLLASRPLPAAVEAKVDGAAKTAWSVLERSVGGAERLREALVRASGKETVDASTSRELDGMVRRHARAELYLESAVVGEISIDEVDLRAAWAKLPSADRPPFATVAPTLAADLRASRLRESASAYYQLVRSRLRLELIATRQAVAAGTARNG